MPFYSALPRRQRAWIAVRSGDKRRASHAADRATSLCSACGMFKTDLDLEHNLVYKIWVGWRLPPLEGERSFSNSPPFQGRGRGRVGVRSTSIALVAARGGTTKTPGPPRRWSFLVSPRRSSRLGGRPSCHAPRSAAIAFLATRGMPAHQGGNEPWCETTPSAAACVVRRAGDKIREFRTGHLGAPSCAAWTKFRQFCRLAGAPRGAAETESSVISPTMNPK